MKCFKIFIALAATLFALFLACELEKKENPEIVDNCNTDTDVMNFGYVPPGGTAIDSTWISTSGEGIDPLTGKITIDCDGFALYDPQTETTFDTLEYELYDYSSLKFYIRFAPEELGEYSCDMIRGGNCGTMTLTGSCVESGEWTVVPPLTDLDLYDIHGTPAGSGAICGDSCVILLKSYDSPEWRLDDDPAVHNSWGLVNLRAIWVGIGIYTAGGEISVEPGRIFFTGPAGWDAIDEDYMMEYYRSIWGVVKYPQYRVEVFFGGANVMSMEGYNVKYFDQDMETWDTYLLDWGMSTVSGIHGTSMENVWAVLSQPTYNIYRFNGTSWELSREEWMTAYTYDVWAADNGEVFVVGSNGGIYHYYDGVWSDETIQDETATLYAVWGRSADDVLAVGSGAAIYHYDGNIWQKQPAPTGITNDLHGVWCHGTSEAWAVGIGGTILHYQ